MPHLGFRQADEDRRLLGVVAPRFDDVLLVVETDAQDLVGIRDHRQPGDIGLLVVGRFIQVLHGVGEPVSAMSVFRSGYWLPR